MLYCQVFLTATYTYMNLFQPCESSKENPENIKFLVILFQKLMGSRTLLSKLMGSMEPIKPMLTTALLWDGQTLRMS